MSIDLKSLLTRNPQEYKGVQLYPILLIDIDIYQIFVETVCIPKDFLYTKEILKMSYLKYILYFIQGRSEISKESGKEVKSYKEMLEVLLRYITKQKVVIKQIIDDISMDDIIFHYEIYIGEQTFYEYDFDNIRKIILEQNGKSLEYIESFNPELEKSLSFFLNQYGKSASLYDRIMIYSTISKTDIIDMSKWTVAEFEIKEDILKKYEEWKVYRPLEASGQIELRAPNKIDNPFEHKEKSKDRYESILINADNFEKDLKQFAK